MNKQKLILSLFHTITIVILVGAPEYSASPQYVANLTAVYGDGSCGACHVIASGSGMHAHNGTFGQHNPNGTYGPRNTNRTEGQRRSNGTFGMRNSNRKFSRNSYGTLFENQPDHTTDQ